MGWMNTLKSIGYFHIDVHWSPLDNHKRRNCNMMNDKFHRSNRDCHSRNHWQFSGICRQQSLWDRCIWSCWSDRCKHRHFYMDWSYIRRYQCGNSFRWNLLTKEKRKMNSSSRSSLLQSSLLPFLQLQFTLLIIWWTPKTCCWDQEKQSGSCYTLLRRLSWLVLGSWETFATVTPCVMTELAASATDSIGISCLVAAFFRKSRGGCKRHLICFFPLQQL